MEIRNLVHGSRPLGITARGKDSIERSLSAIQQEMNHMLAHFFKEMELSMTDWDGKFSRMPAIDLIEKDASFIIKGELAGVSPDDVEIEIRDGFLTIKGTRHQEKEERDEMQNYLHAEISSGSFLRTVTLPGTADCDKAEASFKNGILTVTVPKKEEAVQKPRKLHIKKAA